MKPDERLMLYVELMNRVDKAARANTDRERIAAYRAIADQAVYIADKIAGRPRLPPGDVGMNEV